MLSRFFTALPACTRKRRLVGIAVSLVVLFTGGIVFYFHMRLRDAESRLHSLDYSLQQAYRHLDACHGRVTGLAQSLSDAPGVELADILKDSVEYDPTEAGLYAMYDSLPLSDAVRDLFPSADGTTAPLDHWISRDMPGMIPIDFDFPNRKHSLRMISPLLEVSDEVVSSEGYYVYVTYADNCCEESVKRNLKNAGALGIFQEMHSLDRSDIDNTWLEKNADIMSRERGAGFWLWKPKVILDRLMRLPLSRNVVVVYLDAGACFRRSGNMRKKIVLELTEFRKSDEDVFVHEGLYREYGLTKRDAPVRMGLDRGVYVYGKSALAGFIAVKNTLFGRYFMEEFLRNAEDPFILTDDRNVMGRPNYSGFSDNRHDQTILSLLLKKYRIPMHLPEYNDYLWIDHWKS